MEPPRRSVGQRPSSDGCARASTVTSGVANVCLKNKIQGEERMATVTFTINARAGSVDTEPDAPLLWVVREHLKLTGTKYGCGAALCGAVHGTPGWKSRALVRDAAQQRCWQACDDHRRAGV